MNATLAILTLKMTLIIVDCTPHFADDGDEESALRWAVEKNLPGVTEIANYSFVANSAEAHEWSASIGYNA